MLSSFQNSTAAEGVLATHSLAIPLEVLRKIVLQNGDSNESLLNHEIGQIQVSFSLNDPSTVVNDQNVSSDSTLAPMAALPRMPDEVCQDYCDELSTCAAAKHGSYCKIANSPSTCFSLYWKTDETGQKIICYASDADCPDAEPVLCNTITDPPVI